MKLKMKRILSSLVLICLISCMLLVHKSEAIDENAYPELQSKVVQAVNEAFFSREMATVGLPFLNREATRPSVIIEIAFMDTEFPDNAALRNEGFKQLVAEAIKEGIAEYFSPQPVYEGFFNRANCTKIEGWAWDKNQPNSAVSVDIYAGGTKIVTLSADRFLQDLVKAGKGNGYHGFSYATPSSLKNGTTYSIEARIAGTSTNLGSSPRSITCAPQLFTDGQLLRSGDDYYVYNLGKVFKIPNPPTFEAAGFDWNNFTWVTQSQIANIIGPPIPDTPWGGLIRAQAGDEGRVYVLWQGRHHIPDPSTASDLRGSNWGNYVNLSPNGPANTWTKEQITALPSGSSIPASSSWGTAHNFMGCAPGQLNTTTCGWCTNYVSSKRKIPWSGEAKNWLTNASSWASFHFYTGNKLPVPGAIMVLSVGNLGHVAFVESVGATTFVISEMNWGSDPDGDLKTVNFGIRTERTLTIGNVPNLVGFIY